MLPPIPADAVSRARHRRPEPAPPVETLRPQRHGRKRRSSVPFVVLGVVAAIVIVVVAANDLRRIAGRQPELASNAQAAMIPPGSQQDKPDGRLVLPIAAQPEPPTFPKPPPPPGQLPDTVPPHRLANSWGVRPAVFDKWATYLSPKVGIPARALTAYGYAAAVIKVDNPACNLDWTLLAGVGRVESQHGHLDRASMDSSGKPNPAIRGILLPALGPDVRAMGPMQFIQTTWASWGTDGDGDGTKDIDDLDDAAGAAGRYLCANKRNLATAAGKAAALRSYNQSDEYRVKVLGFANSYASNAE
ncbi:hypothetical protein D5S17_27965 [Pseudonocardiaceae bacterium YIM PH 21723]|nr:hypothetical protein D5S17_27965 [Pseudonocardiaceae bacterium YIM PH 21723]